MSIRYIVKIIKHTSLEVIFKYSWLITFFKFKFNGVLFKRDYIARGIPIINVNLKGAFRIGNNFSIHSGKYFNMIGRQQQCYFVVGKDAKLEIGNNVGISCSAIICDSTIRIGNNVRIGGGCVIYDTDFHSLNVEYRTALPEIKTNVKSLPVNINDGVFIGAHSTILKGVTIGTNSIVGACSVVTKSIPPNEIWAGNPASFVKRIDQL